MGVVAALHDGQGAFLRPTLPGGHAGDLTHCQTVEHGNGNRPDARPVFHVQHGTVDDVPVRVGTVENHDPAAEIGAGVHHPQHRDIIGIEAQSHVLHIHDQHVERTHRLVGGPFRVAVVERADGNASPRVDRTFDMLPGVRRTAKPVLGRKDGGHVEPFAVQQIDQMHPPGSIGPAAPGISATEVWLASTATRCPRSSGK